MNDWNSVKYPLAEAWLRYYDARQSNPVRIDMRQVIRINRFRVYKGVPSIWM